MRGEIDELIEQHLSLVRHIVFQVSVRFPRHIDREELVRAGTLGLFEAARRYEPERGIPFNRFAAQRIRGAILDAVRSSDWAPRSVRSAKRSIDAAEARLSHELGRAPTAAEVAESLELTPRQLNEARDRSRRATVLALEYHTSAGADDDEELTLVDVLTDRTLSEPSEMLETRELHSYVRDAVSLLPERHRRVIAGYFLEGLTSQQLATELGVTASRVSQVRSEALEMLRCGIEAQYAARAVADVSARTRSARREERFADAIATRSTWRDRLGVAAPKPALAS